MDTTLDIDKELAAFEAAERARLGLDDKKSHWRDSMIDPNFKASERPKVTLLVGGLTMAHDYLVEGALKGIGYNVRALDCPDQHALRVGKEFGNRGQCNPTYFTVGNLVAELIRIRDEEGLTNQEVIDNYIFLTAGACGPCRFGMYVTEYRKALRDAGFDGFRVMLFQQTGGVKQASGEELGLVLDPTFFWGLAKALFTGDIINLMSYRLRPYEVEEGAADRAVESAKRIIYESLVNQTSLLKAMLDVRKTFGAVKLDRLRPKPKVAVIGEFWAMTTEGEGNYFLQRFLEEEGSEVDIQIIAHLLLYNLWEFRHDTLERENLRGADGGKFGLEGADVGLRMAGLFAGEIALRTLWQSWAQIMGLYGHVLPDMDEIAEVGHSHYNKELRGGEGHLEVAKLILNVAKNKAHMTLSVKPFGCMPSSGVSDGVQSVVTELFPEAIFCAVETSGDGAVNFYSRVQMFLFKAKQRARAEYQAALAEHGVNDDELRAFIGESGSANVPFFKAPHIAAGTAADIAHHFGPLVGKSALGKLNVRGRRLLKGFNKYVQKGLPKQKRRVMEMAPYMPALLRWLATEAATNLPGGDLPARYAAKLAAMVRPNREEEEAIARAEEAVARQVSKDERTSLPMAAAV